MNEAFDKHPSAYCDQSHHRWAKQDPEFVPHAQAVDDLDVCFHMNTRWVAQLMKAIQRVDEIGTYKQMGFESISSFVCARFGMGHTRACELVDVALCLKHLPRLEAAYLANDLSFDHLRALIRIANDENEQDLVELAKGLSVADTFRRVRLVLEVSKQDSIEARKQRSLETWWDHESRMYEIYGRFPEDMGAHLEKAIDSLANKMPDDPLDEDMPTLMATKRADALYDLALGSIPQQSRSAHVVVHVEAATLASGTGIGEIESGSTLSPESVRRLICDATVQAIIDGADGKPIGFGRTRRTAPPRMVRELIRRDQVCKWPGCTRTKALQAHHIDEWAKDQGLTDFDVMVMFCEHHHYLIHHAGYKIVGLPPYIQILTPQGQLIRNGPPKVPPGATAMFELESELMRAGPIEDSACDDP